MSERTIGPGPAETEIDNQEKELLSKQSLEAKEFEKDLKKTGADLVDAVEKKYPNLKQENEQKEAA